MPLLRTSILTLACITALLGQAQWSSMPPFGGRINCTLALHDTLLVGTPCGIYRSMDNGATFTRYSRRMPSGVVHSLLDHGDVLFACLLQKGIYISMDRGLTWTLSLPGAFLRESFGRADLEQAGNAVFARGYYADSLYVTMDNGQHWTARHVATDLFTNINGAGGKMFCYSSGGALGADGLYRSEDQGQTWLPCTGVSDYTSVVRAVGSTLYAFGSRTFLSTDGGLNFEAVTTESDFGAEYVAYDGTRFYLMQGGNFQVGRATWQPGQPAWQPVGMSLPDQGNPLGLSAFNGHALASREEHVYTTSDGGSNWSQNVLQGINGVPVNDHVVEGNSAMAITLDRLRTANDGSTSWTETDPADIYDDLHLIERTAAGWALGEEWVGVLRTRFSDDQGATWDQASVMDIDILDVRSVVHNDSIYAYGQIGGHPALYVMDAMGAELQDLSNGLFGPSFNLRLAGVAALNGELYTLVQGYEDSAAYIFRHHRADADGWTLSTQQIDGNDFFGSALGSFNGRLLLGLPHGGGVLTSNDGGGTWSDLSTGLDHVTPQAFTVAGGLLYMAADKGVYYLSPAGDQWIDITQDLLVSDVADVGASDAHVWARLRDGGVWTLPINGNVGIAEQRTVAPSLTLWPNPAADVLHISAPDMHTGELDVIDATGRRVLHGQLRDGTASLDVNRLAPGSYRCVLRSEAGPRSTWFVRP